MSGSRACTRAGSEASVKHEIFLKKIREGEKGKKVKRTARKPHWDVPIDRGGFRRLGVDSGSRGKTTGG